MPNPQDFLSKVAGEFSDALSQKGDTPDKCPTCGKPVDDTPNIKKEDAEAFERGLGYSPE